MEDNQIMGDQILASNYGNEVLLIVGRSADGNDSRNISTVQAQTENDTIQSDPLQTRDMVVRYSYGSRRAYVAVIILCFINLINYMDRYTLAGVLKDVKDYYGLDDKDAGLLQTSFIISYLIMAPVFGYLGDRYDRRYIMAFGILFWSATTFLGSCIPAQYFRIFMFTRALVGTGEASYSTIAPTVIADLFTDSSRTRMLSLFYFAIPVGSGLGYIVGPEVANLIGHWYWALRVTPGLGLLAVALCVTVLIEPPRGEAEGGASLKSTSVIQDIIEVFKIPSFLWVSLGFTCVTFSIGGLAWWVPDFMTDALEVHGEAPDPVYVTTVFGAITCLAGIAGVVLGSVSSQYFRKFNQRADPLICAYSMLFAVPFVFAACIIAASNIPLSYALIFFGVTLLCMNWVLVADIVLYVVMPRRRSMAEAIQITLSHALGDAISPYIVGCLSDALSNGDDSPIVKFTSKQYALFLPVFILVVGAACFFINSFYVVEDKERCTKQIQGDITTALLTSIPEGGGSDRFSQRTDMSSPILD
ncbi:protein spinster homolog 1 [Trichonephila inaurata madagascariensis]|uniref:Protein spinster homolog 1 n=1 Tax=Trichonephila inaurata madagascariensis TaxID=2747483 RepID=A0A8X7BVF3_9ARAC|nr:protein spinster homolog 1 [Trichonephila inaurata madagascariensis]